MFKWLTVQIEGEPVRLHDAVPPVIALFVALGLIFAVLYANRSPKQSAPQPWNESAFGSSFDHAETAINDQTKQPMALYIFTLENRTRFDYTLSRDSRLMVLDHGSLDMNRNYQLANNVFLPSGQKAKCVIQSPFLEHAPPVDGFAVFDLQTRYKINLPKPTPPPGPPASNLPTQSQQPLRAF